MKTGGKNKTRRQDGFSLVELSIVIIVAGLSAVLMMSLMTYYLGNREKQKTEAALAVVENAIDGYLTMSGNIYPCPSDITLPPSDPMYGVENRNPATGECQATAAFPAVNGRDVNGNGTIEDSEKILIGGVPYRNLSGEMANASWVEIVQDDILDGWGHQFTYMVTKGLTVPATLDYDAGAIEIKDETDRSLLDVPGSAHMALISHGKNGRGGYDKDGRLSGSCAGVTLPLPPPPAVTSPPSELENCDHDDNVLLSGLRAEASYAYNDDIVRFKILKVSNLWQQTGTGINVPDPSGVGSITIPQIRNANKGKVGVGMTDPQKELDVSGNVAAREIRTPMLCDPSETTCVPPESIGGDMAQMKCGSGQAITYIEGTANPDPGYPGTFIPSVSCAGVTYTPFGADQNCPAGEHVVGITNFGRIVCQ